MFSSEMPSDPLRYCTEQYCAGTLSAEDTAMFEQQLRDDPEALKYFVLYMEMHSQIAWNVRAHVRDEESERSPLEETGLGVVVDEAESSVHPSFIPPIVIDASPPLHASIGSFLFSHVAAAVILGIGLLIGLAWRISLPSSERPTPDDVAQTVARITALADCEWTKQGSEVRGPGSGISEIQIPKYPNPQIPVFLGDRLVLSSGLMQITYNTGAVVLLQGPCTYEIDTDRGGYLAIGKLTALVEKKMDVANHYPLSTTHYPLFAVRTPTAVVTDLGTEFGVEVEKSGTTRSHVFQGSVEMRMSNSLGTLPHKASIEILHAGESVRVERGQHNKAAIIREQGQSGRYVRHISKYSNPQSPIPNPSYRLTDLGTLGGKESRACAIDITGRVVGNARTSDGATHAFLYDHGEMKDIAAQYKENSGAADINAFGQVVAYVGNVWSKSRAVLFSNGVTKDLGTLGGTGARAWAINDAAEIVGVSWNAQGVGHAFLYATDARMKDLGALGGPEAKSCALGISNAGLVTGYSETKNGTRHAFLFHRGGGMKDLGALGGTWSMAYRANDAGLIVGEFIARNGRKHAFLYSDTTGLKDLRVHGSASDVNRFGQIVGIAYGSSGTPGDSRGFLIDGDKVFNLDALVDAATGWKRLNATAINDAGQIVGYGIAPNGATRAFLLTPVDEGQGTRNEGRGIH